MLKVDALQTSYGQCQVLFDVSFEISRGQVVTLIGRNGMGKTTTVRSIMGMTPPHGGSIIFDNKELRGLAPFQVARLGLGLVPEGRQIFSALTVQENLTATAAPGRNGERRWDLNTMVALFPWLAERRNQLAGKLSGGEQQMLAIARALMTNPELLILDEATEGLAPLIRQGIWRVLRKLKSAGQSILLIDKNLNALVKLADRHYVIERGRVRWSGDSQELVTNYNTIRSYVEV